MEYVTSFQLSSQASIEADTSVVFTQESISVESSTPAAIRARAPSRAPQT